MQPEPFKFLSGFKFKSNLKLELEPQWESRYDVLNAWLNDGIWVAPSAVSCRSQTCGDKY